MDKVIKERKKRFWVFALGFCLMLCSVRPMITNAEEYVNGIEIFYDGMILWPEDTIVIGSSDGLSITYNSYEGLFEVEERTYEKEDSPVSVDRPIEPDIPVGEFAGWRVGVVATSGNYVVSIVLNELRQNSITYELDGGSNAEGNPDNYIIGEGVETLEAASKTGYTFDGWYADKDCTIEMNGISQDKTNPITLYAKFTPDNYAITYELDGGTNAANNPAEYTYGAGVESLGDATKTGYTFAGWYSDAAYTTPVTQISSDQIGNITLYAKFEEVVSVPTTIGSAGTVSLQAGTAYQLGSGTWNVAGDSTDYAGGITFYVSESKEYEFVKK